MMVRGKPGVVIYALCDPRTNLVRYVGATDDIIRRTRNHWSGRDSATGSWVRELRARRLVPSMMIVEFVRAGAAAEAERDWIRHYMRRGRLLNKHIAGYHRDPRLIDFRDVAKEARETAASISLALRKRGYRTMTARRLSRMVLSKEKSPIGIYLAVRDMTRSEAHPYGYCLGAAPTHWVSR